MLLPTPTPPQINRKSVIGQLKSNIEVESWEGQGAPKGIFVHFPGAADRFLSPHPLWRTCIEMDTGQTESYSSAFLLRLKHNKKSQVRRSFSTPSISLPCSDLFSTPPEL